MNVLFVRTTTQVCNAVITAVDWEAPGCTNIKSLRERSKPKSITERLCFIKESLG